MVSVFVSIFIILLIIYIIINYQLLPWTDVALFAASTSILVWQTLYFLYMKQKQNEPQIQEHYIDSISTEEVISEIQTDLAVYLTTYNIKSYEEQSGKTWSNIASMKSDGNVADTNIASFTFAKDPIFSRNTGFYLGNNSITGPFCNTLNIKFHNTYSIILACKHGNLINANDESDIELVKLYANSSNNNGLSLFIDGTSLTNNNNIQQGSLMVQYADMEPVKCLYNPNDTLIALDKGILTFYIIIKDIDRLRILTMNEKANTIHEIASIVIPNSDITFSNKEFMINRFSNWNTNIISLGIYKINISNEMMSNYYKHTINNYVTTLDPSYNNAIEKYNTVATQLTNIISCPFDKATCDKCVDVKKWYGNQDVLNASNDCKKMINTFCINNPTHPNCSCWDPTNAIFSNATCKSYRMIFSGDNSGIKTDIINGLSDSDIEYIKEKYASNFTKDQEEEKNVVDEDDSKEYDRIMAIPSNEILIHDPYKAKDPPSVESNVSYLTKLKNWFTTTKS